MDKYTRDRLSIPVKDRRAAVKAWLAKTAPAPRPRGMGTIENPLPMFRR